MITRAPRPPGSAVALALLLSWLTGAPALDPVNTGRTPDPRVTVEKRYPDTEGGYEIWLVNTKEGTEKRLYRTHRSARVLFPTGMDWVVVNDAEGSGTASCKLYRRKGGKGSVDYELARDLTQPAWRFFEEKTGREAKGLHHDYVHAPCWLDGEALVIRLDGHGDPGHFVVRCWTCVYLVAEEKFTVDLEAMNRKSVVETGSKKPR